MVIKTTDFKDPMDFLAGMPDQFVSDKTKAQPKFWKQNMDFFASLAQSEYNRKKKKARNYDLVNGILHPEDFSEEQEVADFIEDLQDEFTQMMEKQMDLPSYVKHYNIMNRPLNTMEGELSKRPDNSRVVALDQDSLSEKGKYFTELMQQIIFSKALEQVIDKLMKDGAPAEYIQKNIDDIKSTTLEKVKDDMASFSTNAEKWGNHILNALKVEFNLKEKSEEGFRDLCRIAEEHFHIYLDKSGTGFNIAPTNPIKTGFLLSGDKKYTKDAYAGWLIDIMELSEIINTFDLEKEDIDHLRKQITENQIPGTTSNLYTNKLGLESIKYDSYNIAQDLLQRQEFELLENKLDSHLNGTQTSTGYFGNRFVVVQAYWISRKKMGLLTYMDESGVEQKTLVDENYKSIPEEIDIKWQWINQWMRGIKIGNEVYHVEELEYINYLPIIGVVSNAKNTEARSMVDHMKPFQMILNVAVNQIWELLEKEIGNVAEVELRRIPTSKDGNDQDALDHVLMVARREGILTSDSSPENLRGNLPNTSVTRTVDLGRYQEIRSRIELATWAKQQCWEMVGMNEQRMGGVAATETAYGTQTALSQSYAQTEPVFAQHEYLMNQVYQAILDVAQWVETKKPESTISYITAEGEAQWLTVAREDISLRDLRCIVSSRAEDQRIFTDIRSLAQHMLQNGADEYTIAELFSSNSIRQWKESMKKIREERQKMQQQQQQLEQAKIQQADQANQAALQQAEQHHQEDLQMEKYKIDTDANVKLAVEQIGNYFQAASTDADLNGVADPQQIADHALKQQEIIAKNNLENMKLSAQQQKNQQDYDLKQRELDVKEKDIEAKKWIAQNNKNKYDFKKK